MGVTPNYGWPYPELVDPANVPLDLKELADAVDATVKTHTVADVPIGALMMWAAAVEPDNWKICNGASLQAVDYPALAVILGQAGGLITLPDLRDHFPVGASAARVLNTPGGSPTLATAQLPGHTHADGTLAAVAVGTHAHGAVTAAVQNHSHGFDRWVPSRVGGTAWSHVTANIFDPAFGEDYARLARIGAGETIQDLSGTSGAGAHSHAITADGAHGHDVSGATAPTGNGAEYWPPNLPINFIIRAR